MMTDEPTGRLYGLYEILKPCIDKQCYLNSKIWLRRRDLMRNKFNIIALFTCRSLCWFARWLFINCGCVNVQSGMPAISVCIETITINDFDWTISYLSACFDYFSLFTRSWHFVYCSFILQSRLLAVCCHIAFAVRLRSYLCKNINSNTNIFY